MNTGTSTHPVWVVSETIYKLAYACLSDLGDELRRLRPFYVYKLDTVDDDVALSSYDFVESGRYKAGYVVDLFEYLREHLVYNLEKGNLDFSNYGGTK
jgi:hypothetical protein